MESDMNGSIDLNKLADSNPPIPSIHSSPSLSPSRLIFFPNTDVFGELTTDQFNALILQFLLEKGFKRTAAEFKNEAEIENISIDENTINKAPLPSLVHKGLRYTQLEANMHSTDASLLMSRDRLEPLDIITNSVHDLSKIIKDRKENAMRKGKSIEYDVSNQEQQDNRQERNIDVHGDALLAVGFSHSAALIWKIADDLSSVCGSGQKVYFLIHADAQTNEQNLHVGTLAWNGEGKLLATGSFSGLVCIWSKNGELRMRLGSHRAAIFFIEWNSKGDNLLTVGCDNRILVWDTNAWEPKHDITCHSEQLLDVAWGNDTSFATISKENIYVFNVGEPQPIKTFSGYQEEIGGIHWNPTGSLLASYGGANAIKIWTLEQDECLHNLMHSMKVYSIRWSPTGPGTNNPSKPYCFLASCSEDTTVKIWDPVQGQLLFSFKGHSTPVVGIEFRPDGNYLASASKDMSLLVWHIKDGNIVKSCSFSDATMDDLSWDREGKLIAASSDSKTLALVDVSFLCDM
ncbi:WD40 repeat-containing protein HOS15-like isoform X2 [Dioscorea cayenensis subsp. rotundata]|uniref:WD40 repeat-containing protein HOS15-like isoform X2 n=1 Tax=Dioscorea cayennensis subsp. rotundata TaxID=55577 RepID=A0AB40CWM4_DIOCR|nr:WD40 repeat-containing protein HOS15-like isoform X2 [Dioscorea cayenensis subsp. rotundata]